MEGGYQHCTSLLTHTAAAVSSNGWDQEEEMISSVPTVWNNHVNK